MGRFCLHYQLKEGAESRAGEGQPGGYGQMMPWLQDKGCGVGAGEGEGSQEAIGKFGLG